MKTDKEQLFQIFMWFSFGILIILGITLTIKSCTAQTTFPTIQTMEYNDVSGEVFDYDGAILMVPSNVIDFVYHTQDNEYIIEYDDPDAFDIDYMTYSKDGDYWYIEITCDSNLFFDYLSYYNSLNGYKDSRFNEASDEYFIEEDYLKDGTPYYKLVKYAIKEDLR